MRSVDAAVVAALEAGTAVQAGLLKIEFPGQIIRLNDTNWTLDFNGETYLGAAGLGSMSEIVDQPGELPGIQLELQNVDDGIIALALDAEDEVQDSPVTISTAIFDATTYQILHIVPDWVGHADKMIIAEDGEKGSVILTAESKGVDLLRGNPLVYNNADQKSLYPSDRAFEYIHSQASQPVVWPKREWFLR